MKKDPLSIYSKENERLTEHLSKTRLINKYIDEIKEVK
jgi:hypothetical protein